MCTNFIKCGLTEAEIEPKSIVSAADAQSSQPLIDLHGDNRKNICYQRKKNFCGCDYNCSIL